ncbi:hypothetical protein MRX96_005761 [Rhipicephalus microplus]
MFLHPSKSPEWKALDQHPRSGDAAVATSSGIEDACSEIVHGRALQMVSAAWSGQRPQPQRRAADVCLSSEDAIL